MGIGALAVCFAPGLVETAADSVDRAMVESGNAVGVVEGFIRNWEELFVKNSERITKPERYVNEASTRTPDSERMPTVGANTRMTKGASPTPNQKERIQELVCETVAKVLYAPPSPPLVWYLY
jgi:hypothetical protein